MPAPNPLPPFDLSRKKITNLKFGGYNPNQGYYVIFDKTYTVNQPMDPSFFHLSIQSYLEPMLDILEKRELIDNKYIYQEYRENKGLARRFTTKQILLELLDQTLMNSIEATSKKWRSNNYIGSSIRIRSFREKDKLWIQIIDNGEGFPKDVLPKVGNESLSSRSTRTLNEFYFSDSLNDHLFKTGQLTSVLGWNIVAENDKYTGGGSVSIVLPCKKN